MAIGLEFIPTDLTTTTKSMGFLVLLTKSSTPMMMELLHSTQEPTQSQAQTSSLCGS
jgi:hypothetical protein